MKKWVVYLLGVLSGVILTFAVAFIVNLNASHKGSIDEPENNDGITYFKEPGDNIDTKSVEVFQVLDRKSVV